MFSVLHPFSSRLVVLFVHLDPSVYVVGYCQVSGDPCLSVHLSLLISICGYDKFLCHCSSLFPQQTLLLNREAEQPVPVRAYAWGAAGQQASRNPHGCPRKEAYSTGEALRYVLFLGRDECLSASVQPYGHAVTGHYFASSGTNTAHSRPFS